MVYEAYNPYIASTVLRTDTPDQNQVRIPKRFPILLSFAKLLLEIELGRIVVPTGRRLDVDLIACAKSEDFARIASTAYNNAVMTCLTAKKDEDGEDAIDDEIQCRQFISKVVNYLKDARAAGLGLKSNGPRKFQFAKNMAIPSNVQNKSCQGDSGQWCPESSFRLDTRVPNTIPGQPRQPQLSTTTLRNIISGGLSNRLFDDQKLQLNNDDPM